MVLSVKDFGLGIPESQLQTYLNPFFGQITCQKFKVQGLGLSIAKEYVEVNKGRIAAKSKLGEGSCFEITFNT